MLIRTHDRPPSEQLIVGTACLLLQAVLHQEAQLAKKDEQVAEVREALQQDLDQLKGLNEAANLEAAEAQKQQRELKQRMATLSEQAATQKTEIELVNKLLSQLKGEADQLNAKIREKDAII